MTAAHEDVIAAAKRMDDMGVSYIELPRLAQPTPREEVKQRPGPHSKSCKDRPPHDHPPLDYVDARYVMRTLDTIVGPENWQTEHTMGPDGKVVCRIGINVSGIGWVWKSDGAGETDIEGEKGSFSDALKRAAVSWGIARDLYDKDRPAQREASASPAFDPARTTPYEEEYRPTRPAQPRAPVRDGDGRCPDHEVPWTLKPGGVSKTKVDENGDPVRYDPFYACPFRPERGQPYCKQKPSKGWLARQEVE